MTRLPNSAACTWVQRHRSPVPQAWRKLGLLQPLSLFTNKTLSYKHFTLRDYGKNPPAIYPTALCLCWPLISATAAL